MTSLLKRKLPVLLLISALLLPARSQAVVGMGIASPWLGVPVMVLGGLVAAWPVGAGIALATGQVDDYMPTLPEFLLHVLIVGTIGALGILLLEDSGQEAHARFAPIDSALAESYGLTPEEAGAYREGLPELNAFAESLEADLVSRWPDGKAKRRELRRLSRRSEALWGGCSEALGQSLCSAAAKVTAGAIATLR